MSASFLDTFRTDGFALAPASAPETLDRLRAVLVEEAARLTGEEPDNPAAFLDTFHERGLTGSALNDFRLSLISAFNERFDAGQLVFEAFRDPLASLVGPDVAVQKSCNIVIQQPGDIDVSPVHRDSPPNSPFEVVVWIPLTRCYGTKGMSMLDRGQTESVLAELRAEDTTDAQQAYDRALAIGRPFDVDYGEACFFWAGLIHAIPVNRERETRWSLNIRYKNLFSPYGEKGLPDFFRILELSPLAALAIESERSAETAD